MIDGAAGSLVWPNGRRFDVDEEFAGELHRLRCFVQYEQGPGISVAAGDLVYLNGQPLVVTGQITRAEFAERVKAAGFDLAQWLECPAACSFWTFTTD